jgi:hypothetical protein
MLLIRQYKLYFVSSSAYNNPARMLSTPMMPSVKLNNGRVQDMVLYRKIKV